MTDGALKEGVQAQAGRQTDNAPLAPIVTMSRVTPRRALEHVGATGIFGMPRGAHRDRGTADRDSDAEVVPGQRVAAAPAVSEPTSSALWRHPVRDSTNR
jgi:hypothetical protein